VSLRFARIFRVLRGGNVRASPVACFP